MEGIPFDQLLARIRAEAEDPLDRLERAVALRETLARQADQVMDHFVGQARAAGLSWTSIGDRMGVSKQAARQRFADRVEQVLMTQLRPRLRSCLAQAEREARDDGSAEVGTQHLLAGLLAEGVAAAVLDRTGVTADAVRQSSHRLYGSSQPAGDAVPPMSDDAIRAIDAATHQAVLGCPDESPWSEELVGTEHLLAVLALDPGSRARRVLNDLGTDIAAIKKELDCHVTFNPRRRRGRGRKDRSPAVCSFCGRPRTAARRLVAGPGVFICGACIGIAAEALASSAPGAADR
ncbi:MAG TPA: Clp protease N-terminal domain-containing protein [Kribbellaceae bacterium]|nr:Clp protease N-terminal domain-containing protein [Kribbellaceae bacterium]